MKRFCNFINAILFIAVMMAGVSPIAVCQAPLKDPVTLSGSGWTIRANLELGALNLENDRSQTAQWQVGFSGNASKQMC